MGLQAGEQQPLYRYPAATARPDANGSSCRRSTAVLRLFWHAINQDIHCIPLPCSCLS